MKAERLFKRASLEFYLSSFMFLSADCLLSLLALKICSMICGTGDSMVLSKIVSVFLKLNEYSKINCKDCKSRIFLN